MYIKEKDHSIFKCPLNFSKIFSGLKVIANLLQIVLININHTQR